MFFSDKIQNKFVFNSCSLKQSRILCDTYSKIQHPNNYTNTFYESRLKPVKCNKIYLFFFCPNPILVRLICIINYVIRKKDFPKENKYL